MKLVLRQVRFMRWWRNASQLQWWMPWMLHSFFTKIRELSGYCVLPALWFLLAKCVGVTWTVFLGKTQVFSLKKTTPQIVKRKIWESWSQLESLGWGCPKLRSQVEHWLRCYRDPQLLHESLRREYEVEVPQETLQRLTGSWNSFDEIEISMDIYVQPTYPGSKWLNYCWTFSIEFREFVWGARFWTTAMKKKHIQAWTSRHRAFRIRFFVRDSHLLLRKIVSENLDKSVSAEKESGTPFTTIPLIGSHRAIFVKATGRKDSNIFTSRSQREQKTKLWIWKNGFFVKMTGPDKPNQPQPQHFSSRSKMVPRGGETQKRGTRCKDENRSSVSLVSSFFDLVHCVVI